MYCKTHKIAILNEFQNNNITALNIQNVLKPLRDSIDKECVSVQQ